MLIKRIPLKEFETKIFLPFLFVLHRPKTNCLEYGFGYFSQDGLQARHTTIGIMHLRNVEFDVDIIRGMPIRCIPPASDRAIYQCTGDYFFYPSDEERRSLAALLEYVRDWAIREKH